jgi:hypothetical protein
MRARLGAAYLERLLRSDLAGHLAGALGRRDPATGELLRAIERFVAAAPAALVRSSDALARDIIEPTLRRLPILPADAHTAAWSLVRAATTADPRLLRHGSDPLASVGLRLASEAASGPTRAAAVALLAVDALPRRLAAGVRGGRRLLRNRLRSDG